MTKCCLHCICMLGNHHQLQWEKQIQILLYQKICWQCLLVLMNSDQCLIDTYGSSLWTKDCFPCAWYCGWKSCSSAATRVLFHVRNITRGWFLVRDSVAPWANFSNQKSPVHETWLQCTCSWPCPFLSKQRMATKEQEMFLLHLRWRRQKVLLNQINLRVALSKTRWVTGAHDRAIYLTGAGKSHQRNAVTSSLEGNSGGNPPNTCCDSAHMEMHFLICDIVCWNSCVIAHTRKMGLTETYDAANILALRNLSFYHLWPLQHVPGHILHHTDTAWCILGTRHPAQSDPVAWTSHSGNKDQDMTCPFRPNHSKFCPWLMDFLNLFQWLTFWDPSTGVTAYTFCLTKKLYSVWAEQAYESKLNE